MAGDSLASLLAGGGLGCALPSSASSGGRGLSRGRPLGLRTGTGGVVVVLAWGEGVGVEDGGSRDGAGGGGGGGEDGAAKLQS